MERHRHPREFRHLFGLGVGLCLLACSASALETVELIPDDAASWRPGNLFAWVRSEHNFGERSITVETSPAEATLDLFYIRSNFQKRYEQAGAPARVVLPPRVEAGPRDAVIIRAFAEGYRQREVSIRVDSDQDHVVIDLEPLPNTLIAASHVYLSGRASLSFLTRESLTVRLQDTAEGFNVILAETAKADGVDAALGKVSSPLIREVESLQLGEDLLVRVSTDPAARSGYEFRSRQARDELRDLFAYSVEMVPADGGVQAVQRARATLAAIGAAEVTGCAASFDSALREGLDPASLARALSPHGAFTDPYLRAAMKRLAEVSPAGRIAMRDGTNLLGASQLELAAAMSQPSEALGYLALLRVFVTRLEGGNALASTLRGLIAPELSPDEFLKVLRAAEAAEARCRGGT